jgi:hypothetical protein
VAGAATELGHVLVDIHGDSRGAAHVHVRRTGRISERSNDCKSGYGGLLEAGSTGSVRCAPLSDPEEPA